MNEIFGLAISPQPSQRVVREQGEVSEDHYRRDAFETHRHRIFALAVYMTGDERVAENLLADTFIRALHGSPSPDGSAVDNAFLVELRRIMVIGDCSLSLSDVLLHVSAGRQRNMLRTELESALLDLPATERLIYLLKDVEGYASERIAALLSLTEPRVKLALIAGRLKLWELLNERRTADSSAA